MRYLPAALALGILLNGIAFPGEVASRRMSGWFSVVTQDGWPGKRYMDGDAIVAEEFDSDGDGRLDVWRFYSRGRLSSEERDLDGDGRVDFQSFWEPRRFRLVSVLRDTHSRGVNDLEVESIGRGRWEVREDRNQDGIADRILIVNGPPDLFERLEMDLARQADVIDNIPVEFWRELRSDEGYTRYITEYRRYNRGEPTHYGAWDGGRVVWVRASPDSEPPSPATAPPRIADGREEPPIAFADPFSEGGEESGRTMVGEPYTDPFADPFADATGYQESVAPRIPAMSDRTRYEGLPPGESGARSLPARMRPPGVGP